MDAVDAGGGELAYVEFPSAVYAIETVQKAALKLTGFCSFDFDATQPGLIRVRLNPLASHHVVDVVELVSRLKNEVLDQHLRALVARETEDERNLILAYTFSKTKLVEP
jgi:His-Xaa-Ser system protein HxsD